MAERSVPPPRVSMHVKRRVPNQGPGQALAPVSFPLGTTKEFSYLVPADGSIEKPGLQVGPFDGAAVATLFINGEEKGKFPLLAGNTNIPISIPVKRMDNLVISFDRELPDVTVVFLYKVNV